MEKIGQELDNVVERYGLENLMAHKKEQLGHQSTELTFIGIADLAEYWYCAQKSLYKQLEMEPKFFYIYLYDRVGYSTALGYLKGVPLEEKALLQAGDEVTFSDVEKLLEERAKEMHEYLKERAKLREKIVRDRRADPRSVIGMAKYIAETFGDSADTPLGLGRYAELVVAKPYPTIRWNFPYRDFVVIGVPDGITGKFVYEFKTTSSPYLILPVARAQADLYGYFFSRSRKIVDVYSIINGEIITEENDVDKGHAERTLERATLVYRGASPVPPKPFKCNKCEYKDKCPIYKSHN